MGVIFYFSAMPVRQSSGTSDGWVTRLIKLFLPDFKSLPAARQKQIRHTVSFIVRKTAHILEFAALGFSLRLHLGALRRHRPIRRAWLWSWVIGTVYAATDELHQFFVPGRGPRFYDVGIDCLGVILGVLFLLLCKWLSERRTRKKTG